MIEPENRHPVMNYAGAATQKHSILGVASLVCGIFSASCEVVTLFISGLTIVELNAAVMVVFIFGGLLIAMLGIGLSVGGFTQRHRKQLFVILGLLLNSLVLLSVGTLVIISI